MRHSRKRRRITPRHIAALLCLGAVAGFLAWLPYKLKEPGIADRRVIVATEALQDPALKKSVILVMSHNGTGAIGLILNTGTQQEGLPVGGPTDEKALHTIHSTDLSSKQTIVIGKSEIGVTAGENFPLLIRKMGDRPRKHITYRGYMTWGRGQLQREIEAGSWKVVDFNSALVFGVNPAVLWDYAIKLPAVTENP